VTRVPPKKADVKPRSVSAIQRAQQGTMLLGGGLLVGLGVLIGSVVTWRIRASQEPPPPLEAADPPIAAKRSEPNYDLLRMPVVAQFRAITATAATAAIAAAEAEELITPPAPAVVLAETPKRPRAKRNNRTRERRSMQQETAVVADAAGTTPAAKTEAVVPQPIAASSASPLEKEEARRLLAASDAIKRAPDSELRARVRDLAATPLSTPAIIAVRDRCGSVYVSLLDGLERLEKAGEKMAGGGDETKLREELEAADGAAEKAKRGVVACEAGLAKLRVDFRN
jgi:hypothetical protein